LAGHRKTNAQTQATVNEVGRLLSLGLLDREIITQLNLKRAQFFNYKQKLYEQSAAQFEKQKMSDLAYHKDLLHDRLTRILRHIETKLSERDDRTGNSLLNPREYAGLALAGQNLAINLFKLESEGQRILHRNGLLNQQVRVFADVANDNRPALVTNEGRGELRLLSNNASDAGSGTENRPENYFTHTETQSDESEVY
jgi:hypothetical protein